VILSVFLFREKLTLRKCGACMTAFLGCCLVTGAFSTDTAIGSKAILFGILTGFGYSLYTIVGRLLLDRKYSIWTITFYTFVFAFCGCLPFVDPVKTVVLAVSSGAVFLNTALMALLNTVFPYLLYTVGLRDVSPSTAPIIAMAEPVVATLVGALCFHETITLAGAAGIGLVIASVAILNGRREQQHGSSDRDGLCEN
ncbi:MAG: DMT family transporter, partial [Clostridia bacterium]|nr:DMT family transporter [Clostridia bacterium]